MLARALVAGVFAAAFLLAALPAPAASSGAHLTSAASRFLATAGPLDSLDAIVTFSTPTGVAKLAALVGPVDALASEPMARASLSAAQVRDVASWPETRSVAANEALRLMLDESVPMIHAPDVWAGRGLRQGYTGAGVGVAVIDSGCDASHPDLPLGAKVAKNYYVVTTPLGVRTNASTFADGVETDTEEGHGTHVASTIAGTGAASGGRFVGVAPGASLDCFKAGTGPAIWTWWALKGFDWVLQNGSAANVRVISNSWGGGDGEDYDPLDPVNVVVKDCYDHGVTVVFAASNSGGPNKLNRYAVSPYVVGVAAVDKQGKLATFSSTGRPGGDMTRDANGLYRPAVAAPGVDIEAARSMAGAAMSTGVDPENPFYTVASGTSMATPHVSGVVALMMQARPQLTPQNVIDILEGTAMPLPYETWEAGAGLVDAYAAVKAAERGQTHFHPSTAGKTPEYLLREGSTFQGSVLPAGYTTKDAGVGVWRATVPVADGVEALYVSIGWPRMTDNVYLFLDDPGGHEVAESAGLLDLGSVNFRTVAVTNPVAGNWTIRVEGRVNLPTDFDGFWGQYDANTRGATKTTSATATDTTTYGGTALAGADVTSVGGVPLTYTSQKHTFTVPAGATRVDVYLQWPDATATDLDLYVYDAAGRQAGSSGQGDTTWERAVVTTDDPMTGALLAGTWTLEVRSWLNTVSAYNGTVEVTHAA